MLPEGWNTFELGDLAEFKSGGTPSKNDEAYWGGAFPWVSAKDLKSHYITTAELGLTEIGRARANVAPVESILVLVRGMTLLKDVPIGFVVQPVAFNQDIKALISHVTVNPLFLSYLLVYRKTTMLALVNTANHGTGRLDTDLLKSLSVLLPPLPEQRKIAEILSTWDRAIEVTQKLIANARAQKKALMQQLLTGKKRLPGFKGEWKIANLESVCSIRKGEQRNRAGLTSSGDFPVINGGVTPSGYTDESNMGPNTITISEGGNSCGFVNLIEVPFWCGGHCYALNSPKVDNLYLLAFLKQYQPKIMALRVGSGLPNIQKKALGSFPIPIPDRAEQMVIGELARIADQEIEKLQSQLNALGSVEIQDSQII